MHCPWWVKVLSTAILLVHLPVAFATTQESASPPSAAPASNSPSADKPDRTTHSHANDFLIRGTVFNEKALSFQGVEIRIRVAGEKKYRWDSYTNSRGEFAVRVPQGASYEIAARAKGFKQQTRTVDAKNGGNEETVVFRMQPIAGGKK